MDMEHRIDRQIAALSEADRRKLLDARVGRLLPGHDPDPEADEIYLRGIVGEMLRDHDAQVEAAAASGIAELERRVAALESILGPRGDLMFETVGKGIAKVVPDLLKRQGYMRHRGTWVEDQVYGKGDCIIDGGGTWLAVADVPVGARPGKALEWRLVAKGEGRS